MQYFIIVFCAFFAILSGYLWLLIDEKDALLKKNASLSAFIEMQKAEHNKEKLEYYEKLQKAKDKTIDKFRLDTSTCEAELESYKGLIRAM